MTHRKLVSAIASVEKTVKIVLFAERGYAGSRMEDLARGLNLSKGSIFQHFKTKERLFLEVYKRAVSSFQAITEYALAPTPVSKNISEMSLNLQGIPFM